MKAFASSILLGGAFIGAIVGVSPVALPFFQTPASEPARTFADVPAEARRDTTEPTAYVGGCRVSDGDTLNCRGERIRLLGIDAPELPGHCKPGRDCAPGDPFASTRSLENAMESSMGIVRVGEDHYGRTLAVISSRVGDLSCHQLRNGHAVYKSSYDDGGEVRSRCPDLTR